MARPPLFSFSAPYNFRLGMGSTRRACSVLRQRLLLAGLIVFWAGHARADRDNSLHLSHASQETWHYLLRLYPLQNGKPGKKPVWVTLTFNQAGSIMLPAHYASVQVLDTRTGDTFQHTHGNPLMEEAVRRGLQNMAAKTPTPWSIKLWTGFQAGQRFNFTRFDGKKGLATMGGKPFRLMFGEMKLTGSDKGYEISAPLPKLGALRVWLTPADRHFPLSGGNRFLWGGLPTQGTVSTALTARGQLGTKAVSGQAWVLHTWGQPPEKGRFTPRPTAQVLVLQNNPLLFQWRGGEKPGVFNGPLLYDPNTPQPNQSRLKVIKSVPSTDGKQVYPQRFTATLPRHSKPCAELVFDSLHPKQEDSIFAGLNARFQGLFAVSCPGKPSHGNAFVRLFGFSVK